ncbi:MAG: ATP-binding protein [Gammaproteobacteria bacterium]
MKANVQAPDAPEREASAVRDPELIGTLQHYSDLFTFGPVGFVVLTDEGRVEDVNRAAAAMLGWPRSWVAGQLFSRWIAKDDIRRFLHHLRRACRSDRTLSDEFRLKDRYGKSRTVRFDSVAMITRVGDPGYGLRRCQTALIDVTEERTAKRDGIDGLAHVIRLNSCGEMAAALAHELSQPLGAIRLYCNAALKSLGAWGDERAKVEALLDKIASAASHAEATIKGLRAYLSKREATVERLELNDVLREGVELATAYAKERGSRIELRLAPALPPVKANRVHIQQVLLNLLQNGIDAMQVLPRGERRVIVTSDQPKPDTLRVTVFDAGPGMTPEQRRRAFEPFYTTKTNGMGMGLSISRSIIESYGGRLWTRNVRRGTAFSFTLPADEHN